MMKKRFPVLVFLLAATLTVYWGKSIRAAEVTVANPAALQAALTDAQDLPGDDIIRLEAGVYDLSSGKLTYEVKLIDGISNGNLVIEPTPSSTGDVILNGFAASRILEITNTGGVNETVTIRGIMFQNAIGTALNSKAPAITIENCKFIDNMTDYSLEPTRLGGGAELTGSVTLKNNLFEGNSGSPDMCGGVTIVGGPILLDSNIFVNNWGGGPYLSLNGGGACIRPVLSSSAVTQNDVILTNNVFDANTCNSFYGCPGGLYIGQTSGLTPYVVITNNTFVNNIAKQIGATAGAAIGLYFGEIHIYNNILWNNLDSSYPPVLRDLAVSVPASGTLNVEYNLFSSDTSRVLSVVDTESNNIDSQDPGLSADYHLPAGISPAKDSGDNNAPGRPNHDFERDPRPANSVDVIDRGADEFTPPPNSGDINDDGNINLTDTLLSLQVVSSIPPSDPVYLEADVNGDARIGLEEAIHGLQVTSGLKGTESETFATPAGNDVTVSALDFDLTFATVTTEGDTTATLFATGPAPPEGFELAGSYFDISTSAEFTGPVQICFDYDDTGMSIAEEDLLQILHYEAGGWQNRTKSLDTALNRICAEVSSFSNFALVFQIPPQIKYFSGNDTTHGLEPWRTDNTTAGTLLLKDITPGNTTNTVAGNFFEFNGHVFFGYGLDEDTQLYRTDGTAAGTVPMNFTNPSQFLVFNDMLYFRADDDDPNTSYAAWYRSNGTDEGTVMLKDIWPVIGSFTYFFDRPTVTGSNLYFLADDGVHGYELWKLDSSGNPPAMVKDIAPAECIDATFYPRSLYPVGDILFFTANDTSQCNAGGRLWKSDGTEAGTVQVSSNVIPQMTQFTRVNSILYFAGYTSNTGIELWRSDGTDSGTALVKDIEPGTGSSNILNLIEANNTLFFKAFTWASGSELWSSDGTYAGTVLVKDIYPGPPSGSTGSGNPQNLANVDNTLYFSADDGESGTELWKSDGTVAGTVMVKDITPGSAGTPDMYFFTSLNKKLLFRANDSSHGMELWTSDGTAEGTFMLKDICAGPCNGFDGY